MRSYAGYLGLDTEASVARFKLETDRQDEEAAALAFPEANEDVRMPQGSLTVIAILLVAAILGGLQLSAMVDRMLTQDPGTPPPVTETTEPAVDPTPTQDLAATEATSAEGEAISQEAPSEVVVEQPGATEGVEETVENRFRTNARARSCNTRGERAANCVS